MAGKWGVKYWQWQSTFQKLQSQVVTYQRGLKYEEPWQQHIGELQLYCTVDLSFIDSVTGDRKKFPILTKNLCNVLANQNPY